MYSKRIQRLLQLKGIELGDRIRVVEAGKVYEGILMPRPAMGDKECLVLKLPNGYNIGLRIQRAELELLEKKKITHLPLAPLPEQEHLPTVSILGAGGTIASRVEYRTGAVFPAFSPTELVRNFPELRELARLKGRKLFDLLSEDLTPRHWQLIAKASAEEIEQGVDGVVLMHGTDTMHYTSAALSFMLQDLPVPVVLTGAQRSSDRGSSDNLVNLVCSVIAACSAVAQVCVCMHGSPSDEYCYLHSGVRVRKMHTSRRDAFKSINAKPYAKIWYAQRNIEYMRKDFRHRDEKRKLKLDLKLNPRVTLLYFHPGLRPEHVLSLAEIYDGLVIAGTGLGHVSTNPGKDRWALSLLQALKHLIDSGIPVVMAPQCLHGRIVLNVYEAGRLLDSIGVIGNGCDWLPEVALVKLMWVLGKTKSMQKIKKLMLTNVAGELSPTSAYT